MTFSPSATANARRLPSHFSETSGAIEQTCSLNRIGVNGRFGSIPATRSGAGECQRSPMNPTLAKAEGTGRTGWTLEIRTAGAE